MWACAILTAGVLCLASVASAQGGRAVLVQEPACQTLTPAAAGGPMPKDPNVVVLRWLGHSNYELAHRDSVILMDAYYERLPGNHAIGVSAADLKRANAIVVGHAHFDHIADAATVARQTGAMVIGAASAGTLVQGLGLPARQVRTVTGSGSETIEFSGFVVQPVLGHHNTIATTVPEGYMEKAAAAIDAASLQAPLTEAEQKQAEAIRARGSRDPEIAAKGTIGYVFNFRDAYRIAYVDSPGPITDAQRRVMQNLPGVDVALLPLVARDAGIPPLMDLVRLFKPTTILLGHHDGPGAAKWASIIPAAHEVRRQFPKTRTLEPLYRTPVCINTATKDVFIGQ
jgi:L-ascorbate metabolism protein UlaG (beta-lactamase superfamily)